MNSRSLEKALSKEGSISHPRSLAERLSRTRRALVGGSRRVVELVRSMFEIPEEPPRYVYAHSTGRRTPQAPQGVRVQTAFYRAPTAEPYRLVIHRPTETHPTPDPISDRRLHPALRETLFKQERAAGGKAPWIGEDGSWTVRT